MALARLTRPVGLKGGLRAQLLCDSVETLRGVKDVLVGLRPDAAIPDRVLGVSVRGNGVVVFLEGCGDREGAEARKNHLVFIPVSESVPPVHRGIRLDELVGCVVAAPDGRQLGRIGDVYDLPGQHMLGVSTDAGEILIPLVNAWVREIDVPNKTVVLVSDELFKVV